MSVPKALIKSLQLVPHPEGGWYRETWRVNSPGGERASATAIYFLLEHGQRSHWHRVDADELWLWHAGHPVALSIADGEHGETKEIELGSDVLQGQQPQLLIPAHNWQSAQANCGWALVSCVVSPGFNFEGFTLAPPGWTPTPA